MSLPIYFGGNGKLTISDNNNKLLNKIAKSICLFQIEDSKGYGFYFTIKLDNNKNSINLLAINYNVINNHLTKKDGFINDMVYNYNKQLDTLRHDTLVGKGLDPMIFLSATIFMMALGLIFIRLINYLLRLLYRVSKNRLKPAGFAPSVSGFVTRCRDRETGTLH